MRDIRRLIAFLVVNGFSLLELRKLYLDELYDFEEHTIFTLEQMGTFKAGSYDKLIGIKNKNKVVQVEDTINQLRQQLKNTVAKK